MANMNQNGGGIGTMMQPKKKFKMQGGVRNYLGNQKQVKAPLNWQSSPDHPKTELAYITKKEKDLLVKKDLHGSLKGGVNRGPSGIMSLNGFGSTDSSQNVSGSQMSAAETGGSGSGMTSSQASAIRSAAINAGAGQKVNPGFFGGKYNNTVSQAEIAAARAARNNPNNRFGAAAYDRTRGFGSTGIGGLMKGFNPLSMILGLINPFLGIASRGIGSLKGGFKGLTGKMRGINPLTGEPNTQAEYEAMVNNRRTEGRRDKMQERIDRGYNSIFGMRTGPITDQQRSTLANLNTQTGISNNVIGGDPTSTRFDGFAPRVGNTNTMPNANVTGLNSDITSNQINEFGDGRMGNINDEFGQSPEFNVSQINEFGESPEFNASQINEFGQSPEFNAGLVNEFGTSPQFNTSLINEFGDNRNINMNEFATQNNIDNRLMQEYLTDQAGFQQPITASQIDEFGDNRNINMNEFAGNDIQMQNYLNDQANYNADPFGNPNMDPRIVSEEYGLVGNNGITSLTNNALPGNNMVAEITQKDIDRFKQPMTQIMDYDTYKSINLDSTVTPKEFEQLKAQV